MLPILRCYCVDRQPNASSEMVFQRHCSASNEISCCTVALRSSSSSCSHSLPSPSRIATANIGPRVRNSAVLNRDLDSSCYRDAGLGMWIARGLEPHLLSAMTATESPSCLLESFTGAASTIGCEAQCPLLHRRFCFLRNILIQKPEAVSQSAPLPAAPCTRIRRSCVEIIRSTKDTHLRLLWHVNACLKVVYMWGK